MCYLQSISLLGSLYQHVEPRNQLLSLYINIPSSRVSSHAFGSH